MLDLESATGILLFASPINGQGSWSLRGHWEEGKGYTCIIAIHLLFLSDLKVNIKFFLVILIQIHCTKTITMTTNLLSPPKHPLAWYVLKQLD